MAFPGANAHVYRNEVGEPIGWDYPSDPDPADAVDALEDYYERHGYGDDDEGAEDQPARLELHGWEWRQLRNSVDLLHRYGAGDLARQLSDWLDR